MTKLRRRSGADGTARMGALGGPGRFVERVQGLPAPAPTTDARGARLSVAYATDAGPVVAVDHVDLDLDRGEFLGIVGRVRAAGSPRCCSPIAQLLSPPASITGGSVSSGAARWPG